jgi:hypothetical protein
MPFPHPDAARRDLHHPPRLRRLRRRLLEQTLNQLLPEHFFNLALKGRVARGEAPGVTRATYANHRVTFTEHDLAALLGLGPAEVAAGCDRHARNHPGWPRYLVRRSVPRPRRPACRPPPTRACWRRSTDLHPIDKSIADVLTYTGPGRDGEASAMYCRAWIWGQEFRVEPERLVRGSRGDVRVAVRLLGGPIPAKFDRVSLTEAMFAAADRPALAAWMRRQPPPAAAATAGSSRATGPDEGGLPDVSGGR